MEKNTSLVTLTEAAKLLDQPRSTVAHAAQQGRLPIAAKLPGLRGAYLFDRSTIAALAVERGVKL